MKYIAFSTLQGYCVAAEKDGKLTDFYLPEVRYDIAINRALSEYSDAEECETALLKETAALGTLYFSGGKADFAGIPTLQTGITEFEAVVFSSVKKIPYGKTISYKGLAENAGLSGKARAVGNALNKNRLPVIIPCHRVIKNSGELGGYSKGQGWKIRLLLLEKSI